MHASHSHTYTHIDSTWKARYHHQLAHNQEIESELAKIKKQSTALLSGEDIEAVTRDFSGMTLVSK